MITNTIRNLFQYLSGADLGGTWTYIGDPANFAVLGSTTTFWNTDDVLPSEDSNLPHIVKIGLLYLTEPGLYQFKYTVTDIYGCVSESIVKIYVSINYRSGVSKSDIVVCTNRTESSFVNLYDYLIPNSYDLGGTWSYIPNQFGSISISQTGIVNLYNLNPGLYQFKYETTNGNCLSSTIIDIQIEQGGNAGNDVDLGNFCYGDNEILNLSQQFIQSQICTPDCENPIDLTGNYIYVSGPALLVDVNGQTYNIDDIIVNTNLNLQVLAPGVYVVKYQIGNGLCDAFSLIKFTILDTPTIIFDNDLLQICSNPTNPPVTITAQVVSAYNGLPFVGPYTFKWYLNNQQLNNNSLVFSYTFVENETCEIQTSEVKLIVTTPSCGDYEKIGSIELYPYLDFFASDTPIEVCDSGEYNLNDYFTIPIICDNTVITFTDNLGNVITNPDTYTFTTLGNVTINVNITQDICSVDGFLFFNVTETSYAGEDTLLEVCKNCDNQVLLTTNYISLCIYDNLLPAPINLNDYILIGNGTWSQIGNPSFSGNIYTSSVVGIEEFQIISQKPDCPDSIQSLIIETKNCCEDNTQIFPKQVCPNIQYDLFNMISGDLSGIFAIDNIITNHIINTGNYTEGDHTVAYTISKPNCNDVVLTEILTIDCPTPSPCVPWANINITINSTNTLLTPTITNPCPGATYIWQYSASGTGWLQVGTNLTQSITNGVGYYRFILLCPGCSPVSKDYLFTPPVCDFQASIGFGPASANNTFYFNFSFGTMTYIGDLLDYSAIKTALINFLSTNGVAYSSITVGSIVDDEMNVVILGLQGIFLSITNGVAPIIYYAAGCNRICTYTASTNTTATSYLLLLTTCYPTQPIKYLPINTNGTIADLQAKILAALSLHCPGVTVSVSAGTVTISNTCCAINAIVLTSPIVYSYFTRSGC